MVDVFKGLFVDLGAFYYLIVDVWQMAGVVVVIVIGGQRRVIVIWPMVVVVTGPVHAVGGVRSGRCMAWPWS